MRICHLAISNYRNVTYAQINPAKIGNHDLVVLIGENGAAKTSILALLHAIFNPERSVRTLDFSDNDFLDLTQPITLDVIYEDLSDELRAEFVDVLDSKPDTDDLNLLPLSFNCSYDSQTNEAEPALTFTRNPDRNVSVREKKMISYYLQDALRDYRTIHHGKTSMFERMLKQIDLSAQEQEMLNKLNEASEILHENEKIDELKNGVFDVANKIIQISDDANALRLTVAASDAVDLKRNIRFQIRKLNTERYLDVAEVELGLQSVLTMGVFRSFAEIGELQDGIFAIDEPEAHLYPHSQRAMYREIMNLASIRQVWIATHSPTLLEYIDPRQIVRMKKDADGTATAIQLPLDFPAEHVYSYEKHLDVGKSDAFFSKAVLLVEGPTEQGLIPSLWRIVSPENDFDRLGISVLNVNGKNNMKAFIHLLNNFRIPCKVIVDYDKKDKKHDQTLDEIKQATDYVFELPREPLMGDIEGYMCLRVPIQDILNLLDETVSEPVADSLMDQLQGILKQHSEDSALKIKEIRQQDILIPSDLTAILDDFILLFDEERRIREVLAGALRKVKGRTTGRMMAEKFNAYIPKEFLQEIGHILEIAGYVREGVI